MSATRTAVPLLVCAALLLAGCGGSRSASPPANAPPASAPPANAPHPAVGTLRLSPAQPLVGSLIRFSFVAPMSSGAHGRSEIGYSLSIMGARAAGCVAAYEASPGRALAGRTTTIPVGPPQLGRPWCPGAYSARVIELQRPRCATGVPCPQFIRVVAIVARARFQIRRD